MTTWLIDMSALVRLAASPDAGEWAARIERGLVRITTVTRLDTGYSARSGQRPPLSSMLHIKQKSAPWLTAMYARAAAAR